MLLKDFVNKKMASAEKVASAEGVPLTLNNCKKYKKMREFNIYGNCFQSTLPYPYQSVQYIESTGTQYIDTGFYGTSTRIQTEVKFSLSKIQAYGPHIISNDGFFIVARNNNNGEFFYVCGDSNIFPYSWELNKDYVIKTNANEAMINDDTFIIDNVSEVEQTKSIFLMTYRNEPQSEAYSFSGKLYYTKLYYDNVLVRNFVPCYNVETNAIGLYDTVNSIFYPNKGGGVFIKGSNTVPTPEAPIEVQSVGEKSVNLLREDLIPASSSYGGVTCDYEGNGVFHIHGEYTNNGSSTIGVHPIDIPMNIPIEADSYYTIYVKKISGSSNAGYHPYFGAKSNDVSHKNWLAGNVPKEATDGQLFKSYARGNSTVPDAYSTSRFWIYTACYAGNTLTTDMRIQVWFVKGNSGDVPYEPYGKYRVPIVQRGKNLCTPCIPPGLNNCTYIDGVVTQKTADTTTNPYFKLNGVLINGTQKVLYTTSVPSIGERRTMKFTLTDDIQRLIFGLNGSTRDTTINIQKIPTGTYVFSFKLLNNVQGSFSWCDMQIEKYEEGVTPTDFEPYVESIRTNLYLDEPLRKLANHTDYIDGKNDKVMRNVYEQTILSSNSSYKDDWYYDKGINAYAFTIKKTPYFDMWSFAEICTHFQKNTSHTSASLLENSFHIGRNMIWLMTTKASGETVEDFKALLAEKEAEGNPVRVYYRLAEPIEELLNIELPKLNAKTTIIEIDTSLTPSNISGKYIIR